MSLRHFEKNAAELGEKMSLCSSLDEAIRLQKIYTPYFQDEIIVKLAAINFEQYGKIEEKAKIKLETKK